MEDSGHNLAVAGGKLITDLKVLELKAELEARGLNKYGNKRELLERLRAYLLAEREANTSKPESETRSVEVPNPWLHEEANLENDFIREYLQSQQALFRQQIGAPTAGCVPSLVSAAEPPSATPALTSTPALLPYVGKKRGRKKKKKNKVASEEHQVLYSSENVSAVAATDSPSIVQHSQLRFKLKASGCESAEASSSSWCGDDGGAAQRPSRSSARTSRALSRVSLEDEDSTPPLTAATSPSVSPPRTSSSLPILASMRHASSSLEHAAPSPPHTLSSLTLKINRDDNPDVFGAPSKHHKKKHKKHSKAKVARVPSLKIKFNESYTPTDSSRKRKGGVLGLSEVAGCTPEPGSEVLPFIVSPCSASPQNSEVSSSIQDLGGGDHHLSPAATTAIMSPKSFESLSDPKSGVSGDKQAFEETPRSSNSQWRKSKRLIADLSEKATRRVSARERGGLSSASSSASLGRHAEQQSPDTSERDGGGATTADDAGVVQTVRLSGVRGDGVPKRFDGLRVQLHRESVPLCAESAVVLRASVAQRGSGAGQQPLLADRESRERELREKRELEEKRVRDLNEKHERELKQRQENELKEKRERELREKRELYEQRQQELKERRELELRESRERELEEKRNRERRERELLEKQERERCERELQERRQLAEKRERELKEKREAELLKQKKMEEEQQQRAKQERELQAKRALELREQQDRALKEEREKNRRQQELKRRQEEEAKLRQEVPPSPSKVGVTGALVGGKTPKKSRAPRAKKVAPPPAAPQQPQTSVVWQPPPLQVIEGNLTLQKEVHVPNSLDLIVSQVTCGLSEESVPRTLPPPSSLPSFTSACDSSVATDGSSSCRLVLPVITSPDHSNLVSLTPVPESSLFETPLHKVKSSLIASEHTPLKPDESESLRETPLLKVRSNLTASESTVEEPSVQPGTLTSQSLLPSTASTAITDVTLSSFLAPSPVLSPRRSSQESPSKSFGSPPPTNADDLRLASEVQDATYYLVKELQEQDSSYGHRRRSLDEISSPECTSTTVYSSSVTSPLQSPRFMSPERLISPPPSVTRSLAETSIASVCNLLVVSSHSATTASSSVNASTTSSATISPLGSSHESALSPSRSVTHGVSVRPISSLLEPSSSFSEKSLISVTRSSCTNGSGKPSSQVTPAKLVSSASTVAVAATDDLSVALKASVTAEHVEMGTSVPSTSVASCVVVTSNAQVTTTAAAVSTPISGVLTASTETRLVSKTSDITSPAIDFRSAATDSLAVNKTTCTDKLHISQSVDANKLFSDQAFSGTVLQSGVLGESPVNIANEKSPIINPAVNVETTSPATETHRPIVESDHQLGMKEESLCRVPVDVRSAASTRVSTLKSVDVVSPVKLNEADTIPSKSTPISEGNYTSSKLILIESKSKYKDRVPSGGSSPTDLDTTVRSMSHKFLNKNDPQHEYFVPDSAEDLPRLEQDGPIIDNTKDAGNLEQQRMRRPIETERELLPREGDVVSATVRMANAALARTAGGDSLARSAEDIRQPSGDSSRIEMASASSPVDQSSSQVQGNEIAQEKLSELAGIDSAKDVSCEVAANVFELSPKLKSTTSLGAEERSGKEGDGKIEKPVNTEGDVRSGVTVKVHSKETTASAAILKPEGQPHAKESTASSKVGVQETTALSIKGIEDISVLSKEKVERSSVACKEDITEAESATSGGVSSLTNTSREEFGRSNFIARSNEAPSAPVVTGTSLPSVHSGQTSPGSGSVSEQLGPPKSRGVGGVPSAVRSAKKGHTGFSVADLLQKTDSHSVSVSTSLMSLPDLTVSISSSEMSSSTTVSTVTPSFSSVPSISSLPCVVLHVSKTPCVSVLPSNTSTLKLIPPERNTPVATPTSAVGNIPLSSPIECSSQVSSRRRSYSDPSTDTESRTQLPVTHAVESSSEATPHSASVSETHSTQPSAVNLVTESSTSAGLPAPHTLPVRSPAEVPSTALTTRASSTGTASNFPCEGSPTSVSVSSVTSSFPLTLCTSVPETPSTAVSISPTLSLAPPSPPVPSSPRSSAPALVRPPLTTQISTHITQSCSATAASHTIPTTAAIQTVSSTAVTQAISSTAATQTVSSTAATQTIPTTAATQTIPTTAATQTIPTTAATQTIPTTAATQTIPTTAATQTIPTTAATQTISTTAATQTISITAATQTISITAATQTISTAAATQTISTAAATRPISTTAATQTASIAATHTVSTAAATQIVSSTTATQAMSTTTVTQPISTTGATQSISTTAATQPISTTAATRPISTTAATRPISTTATIQPISITAAIQPISITAAIQPISTTAAIQPISITAAIQPISTTAATQPISTTAATLPISTTAATQVACKTYAVSKSNSITPNTKSHSTTPTTSFVSTTPNTNSSSTTSATRSLATPTSLVMSTRPRPSHSVSVSLPSPAPTSVGTPTTDTCATPSASHDLRSAPCLHSGELWTATAVSSVAKSCAASALRVSLATCFSTSPTSNTQSCTPTIASSAREVPALSCNSRCATTTQPVSSGSPSVILGSAAQGMISTTSVRAASSPVASPALLSSSKPSQPLLSLADIPLPSSARPSSLISLDVSRIPLPSTSVLLSSSSSVTSLPSRLPSVPSTTRVPSSPVPSSSPKLTSLEALKTAFSGALSGKTSCVLAGKDISAGKRSSSSSSSSSECTSAKTSISTSTVAPTLVNTTKDLCSHKSLVTTVNVSELSLPESKENVKSLEYSTNEPGSLAGPSNTSPSITRSSDLTKPRVPYSMVIGRPAKKIVFTPLKWSQKFTSSVQSSSFNTAVPVPTTSTVAVSAASTADTATVTSQAAATVPVSTTATVPVTCVVAPRKSRWDMRSVDMSFTTPVPDKGSNSAALASAARDSKSVSSSSTYVTCAHGTPESFEAKKDIVSRSESVAAPTSRVSSSFGTHPDRNRSTESSTNVATDPKLLKTVSPDSPSVTSTNKTISVVSAHWSLEGEEEISGKQTEKKMELHSAVSPMRIDLKTAENTRGSNLERICNEEERAPCSSTGDRPDGVSANQDLHSSYSESHTSSSSSDRDSPPPCDPASAVAFPASADRLSHEESALSENFINMGRTSRRRTSAAAADTENTATTRRSSRHSSKATAAVVASSPPPATKADEVTAVENRGKNPEPVKNGDRTAEDQGGLHEEEQNKSNDFKSDRSAGKHQQVEEQTGDDEGAQRASGRTRSRSRSVEAKSSDAPAVRRSRRLSRGSSVELSDDEGGLKGVMASRSGGETGLQTIQEQGESPEKRRSLGEVTSPEKRKDEAGKEREEASKSDQPEFTEKEKTEEETPAGQENVSGDAVLASSGDVDNLQDDSEGHITDKGDSTPAIEENRAQQDPENENANQTKDATTSDVSDHKSLTKNEADQNVEEDADKVDDGDGVDAVKLTLETSETLDKFDDTDEEEMVPASASAKRPSPQKTKRRSRSPHKRRRRSSSSSSSESSSRRRRHRRREEGSSSQTTRKQDDTSSRRSSSNKKSNHRDSELSSPIKNGSDKQLSESRVRSPGSGSRKKHSPIVLRGLPGQTDEHQDDRKGTKYSRKSSSSDHQQSEERDTPAKKDEEPVDDFDYSSFKSSRRVSLSKKLRDPDNDKARKTSAAAATVSLKSSEPSIELSSQSLKGLLPDVHPVPESELKLEEDEGDQEEAEKKKNLGSLSDSELRERKLLLQKKLQGLEEKERQEKKKKQSSKDVEKASKKSGDKDEITFSDPEEEERALRRAAQESMRAKLAKKEELARRLDREDDELLPEKKKVKKDRDVREGSPLPKKSREGREVRVVEGPAVVPRKTPSIAPARNPTSCVVIIRNLTRPFTLRQLQTLLQRTGRIVQPDGFWVDNVKSVCVARFENEDQAEETRMHLHGIQWPTSNPKTLFVDFTTQEDLERRLKESGGPILPQPQDQLRRKASAATVREWDRVKLGERSPGEREREKELQKRRREDGDAGSDGEVVKRADQRGEGRGRGRSREWDDDRHDRDRKTAKKEVTNAPPEKPAPKSLDDLFNKTKAKPSIYWLPLNKEQIAEKEAMRRKLMAENEKQLAALKLKHEKEREEREKQRQEREKQREAEKKERAAAAAKKKKSRSRSRSRKRSPKRSSRSRRRSRS